MQWVGDLLEAGRQMAPHGYCLLWRPELVWLHVVSDALIALAYFSIPVALVAFVRRRPDLDFGWVLWLFALFIVACGATHVMSIWTLWHADYLTEGLIKALTALASMATAILLWPVIPKLIAIPSPTQVAADRDRLALLLEELTRESEERRKAEAALRQAHKMEAVGQLTGGIAHDFNNLLQTVTGAVDMIARQPDGPKVGQWASLALQASERGSKLTGQLLAFSRTQRLQLKPITIAPLVEGMRELLQSSVGPRIALRFDLDGPALLHVCSDPTQIELALLNLAVNARDAMPDGGTITISTRPVVREADVDLAAGTYLELAVEDTGQGMPDEVVERAFEPFFTTKGGKGSGLGLAMVYGVAKQSGGRAEIQSVPGQGTRISLLLKVVEADGSAIASEVEAQAAQTASKLVLLVDDDALVRSVTAGMLEELGHRVIEEESAAAALAALDKVQPDLLITDFAMPEMTGAQLAARVREGRPDLPILVITGFSDTAAIEQDLGEDQLILKKPFVRKDLAKAVEAASA